ncbi:MFS transporter [Nocardioides immobilis]|uniref:MFS transporter n=1 Tax=Nocardioides immobilis TaxID=2049295 RepID=A0A417XSV3_9ACTN|nr:MFS transporter [Nocardioides immobilis]
MLGGDALSAVGSGMTLPFLLVYLSQVRGIDVGVAGLAVATVALAGFAGNPVGGWLSDVIGSRRALVCGLLVSAVGAFTVTLVRDPWHAFAASAVVGVGLALVTPAQDALLATVVEPRQRPTVFAVRNATLNAGYGVGGVAAAFIADLGSAQSFVVLYVVDGCTFLLFVPVLIVLLPDAGRATRRTDAATAPTSPARRGYRAVLRDTTFLQVWVLMAFLVTIGFAQTLSGFPAYATGDGGVGAHVVGIAFAANTFAVVLLQLPVLRVMTGHRRTTGMALACTFWAVAWVVTAIAGTSGGGSLAAVGLTAALVVFAVGETLLAPSQASLVNDLAPDDLRGRYNGLYTLAWTTGLMVGPALAGFALGAGHGRGLFLGLAAACLVAASLTWGLGRRLPAHLDVVASVRDEDPVDRRP